MDRYVLGEREWFHEATQLQVQPSQGQIRPSGMWTM